MSIPYDDHTELDLHEILRRIRDAGFAPDTGTIVGALVSGDKNSRSPAYKYVGAKLRDAVDDGLLDSEKNGRSSVYSVTEDGLRYIDDSEGYGDNSDGPTTTKDEVDSLIAATETPERDPADRPDFEDSVTYPDADDSADSDDSAEADDSESSDDSAEDSESSEDSRDRMKCAVRFPDTSETRKLKTYADHRGQKCKLSRTLISTDPIGDGFLDDPEAIGQHAFRIKCPECGRSTNVDISQKTHDSRITSHAVPEQETSARKERFVWTGDDWELRDPSDDSDDS